MSVRTLRVLTHPMVDTVGGASLRSLLLGGPHDPVHHMRVIALGVRFLLELCGIASMAIWAHSMADGIVGWAAAVMAPGLLVAVWAAAIAPKARSPLSPRARTLVGGAVLIGTAAALTSAGHQQLGAAFAATALIDTLVLDWTRQRPEA